MKLHKLAYLVLLLSSVLVACNSEPPEPTPASLSTTKDSTEPTTEPVRFLALGDSYTIGHGVHENARWPVQMVAQLRENEIAIEDAEIIARTGWTTRSLLSALEVAAPEKDYDVVSLLIGVNNQYQGQSLAVYEAEFNELLALAITYAGHDPKHVVVISIPDYGVTPFAAGSTLDIGSEIDAFNNRQQAIAEAAGVHYVDITPYSREAAEDRSLIAPDGLHPSGIQYSGWVERALPVFERILEP